MATTMKGKPPAKALHWKPSPQKPVVEAARVQATQATQAARVQANKPSSLGASIAHAMTAAGHGHPEKNPKKAIKGVAYGGPGEAVVSQMSSAGGLTHAGWLEKNNMELALASALNQQNNGDRLESQRRELALSSALKIDRPIGWPVEQMLADATKIYEWLSKETMGQ